MKTVYFAHPKAHYDTEFEMECIEIIVNMLTSIGSNPLYPHIEIFNPNQKIIGNVYKARKESGDRDPFEFFREIARAADIVVGVTFFDGSIGAGVAEELDEASKNGKDCYLIYVDNQTKVFIPFIDKVHYKTLSIKETVEKTKRGEM